MVLQNSEKEVEWTLKKKIQKENTTVYFNNQEGEMKAKGWKLVIPQQRGWIWKTL